MNASPVRPDAVTRPKNWRRWAETGVRRFVYAVYSPDIHAIKLGCSYRPEGRMREYGKDAIPLAFAPGGYDAETNRMLFLKAHRLRRYSREWFKPTPEVLLVVSEMMFVQRARDLNLDRVNPK